jgi:hypothetical protein
MFKRMYICMHTVGVLNFGLFNPFKYSPLHLYPILIFQQFSLHIRIPLPSHLMLYNNTDVLLFFFLSLFPQIPLLQKCSTTEFVYDHVCFVYILIFGPIFWVWEKTCVFCVFDLGLFHWTWWVPIVSIYLHFPCHHHLCLSNTPVFIYTKYCMIHSSIVGH